LLHGPTDFLNLRAIVKQEFRNPASGEIYTGPAAVRAGLVRAILFIAFFVFVVIYLFNA
jgi:hypothetical protein